LGSTIENSSGFGISLDELSNEKEIKEVTQKILREILIGKKELFK